MVMVVKEIEMKILEEEEEEEGEEDKVEMEKNMEILEDVREIIKVDALKVWNNFHITF
jgi:hypothetical protein